MQTYVNKYSTKQNEMTTKTYKDTNIYDSKITCLNVCR